MLSMLEGQYSLMCLNFIPGLSLEVVNSERGEQEPWVCPETRLNKGIILSLASRCQFRDGENPEAKCNPPSFFKPHHAFLT